MEYDSLAGTMQTSRLFLPGLMPRIISQCCCYVDFVLDFFLGGGGGGGGGDTAGFLSLRRHGRAFFICHPPSEMCQGGEFALQNNDIKREGGG